MGINVNNFTCAEKSIGPGMTGYFAEMECEKWSDEGKYEGTFYISITDIIGYCYYVSKNSVFDFYENNVDDMEELEHYETLSDTAKSEFFNHFIYLEKLINDLNKGFETVAPKNKIENRVRNHEINIIDEEDYYLAATDTFEVDGKTLIAKVVYGTAYDMEVVDISLSDEDDNLIEGYEDLDEAIESEYIMLFCELNNYLKGCVTEYFWTPEGINPEGDYFLDLFAPEC